MTTKRSLNLILDDQVAGDFDTQTPHYTDVSVNYTLHVRKEDGTLVAADPDIPMFWSALLDAVMATVASDECVMSATEAKRILGAAFGEVLRTLERRAAKEEMSVATDSVPMHLH